MADITVDQFVEDLEVLCVTFGFEKISLVGHSGTFLGASIYQDGTYILNKKNSQNIS